MAVTSVMNRTNFEAFESKNQREAAELQVAYQHKCEQIEVIKKEQKKTLNDFNLLQSKLKKLKYENEKLYQDC